MPIRCIAFILAALCCPALAALGSGTTPTTGQSYNVAISPAGGSLGWGILGQLYYSPILQATGVCGNNPDNYVAWEIVEGALPPGLTLSADANITTGGHTLGSGYAVIWGYPLETGRWNFTIRLRDNYSDAQDVQRYSIVTYVAGDFALQQGCVPDAQDGTPYSQTLLCSIGAGGPYTWSWQAAPGSQLPPGLALDTSSTSLYCDLAGTPTAPGDYDVIVSVNDGASTVSMPYNLRVGDLPLAVTTPGALPDGMGGIHYGCRFTATRGVPRYHWLASGLPAGFTLDYATGYLSADNPQPGSYNFDVTVRDSKRPGTGATATRTFTLTILPPGSIPAPGTPAAVPSGRAAASGCAVSATTVAPLMLLGLLLVATSIRRRNKEAGLGV